MTTGRLGRGTAATLALLASAAMALPAGAAVVGSWDANGTASFEEGVVGLGINRGRGLTVGNGADTDELTPIMSGVRSGRFSTSGFANGIDSAAGAIAEEEFITWSIVSSIGLDLDVLNINIDGDVASNPPGFLNEETDGPPVFEVLASVDGGAFVSLMMGETPESPTAMAIDLTSLPVSNRIDFRIVGYGFDEAGRFGELQPGRTDFDLVADPGFASLGNYNAVVNVEGAIIPVPGALPLFLTALGLGAFVARRRKAA